MERGVQDNLDGGPSGATKYGIASPTLILWRGFFRSGARSMALRSLRSLRLQGTGYAHACLEKLRSRPLTHFAKRSKGEAVR